MVKHMVKLVKFERNWRKMFMPERFYALGNTPPGQLQFMHWKPTVSIIQWTRLHVWKQNKLFNHTDACIFRACTCIMFKQLFVKQVTEQCHRFYEPNADKVHFALYYESMCPGCRDFFRTQLTKTFTALKDIMDLTLVPYGNAWVITCTQTIR